MALGGSVVAPSLGVHKRSSYDTLGNDSILACSADDWQLAAVVRGHVDWRLLPCLTGGHRLGRAPPFKDTFNHGLEVCKVRVDFVGRAARKTTANLACGKPSAMCSCSIRLHCTVVIPVDTFVHTIRRNAAAAVGL